jgi:phosphohistidine phosphatase
MNLYLLRHGLATKRSAPKLRTDRQRPLTPVGVRKMRKIAKAMQTLGLSFDLILSSPFLRAWQTAEIVAEVLQVRKRLQSANELGAGASPRAILRRFSQAKRAPQSVLLVGHEPYLSNLASLLLAGHPRLQITLKKGGLCKLSFESPKFVQPATLDWLLTPKLLAALR